MHHRRCPRRNHLESDLLNHKRQRLPWGKLRNSVTPPHPGVRRDTAARPRQGHTAAVWDPSAATAGARTSARPTTNSAADSPAPAAPRVKPKLANAGPRGLHVGCCKHHQTNDHAAPLTCPRSQPPRTKGVPSSALGKPEHPTHCLLCSGYRQRGANHVPETQMRQKTLQTGLICSYACHRTNTHYVPQKAKPKHFSPKP